MTRFSYIGVGLIIIIIVEISIISAAEQIFLDFFRLQLSNYLIHNHFDESVFLQAAGDSACLFRYLAVTS